MTATVAAVWRYPVKSMQGELVTASSVSERGIAGDRAFGLVDRGTGKLCSAKHPRKWGKLLSFRAAITEQTGSPVARITFPDGDVRTSDDPDISRHLSDALGADVDLVSATPRGTPVEEVWPQVKGPKPYGNVTGSENDDPVTEFGASFAAPEGTMFDLAPIHLITTATLRRLQELAPASRFDVARFRPNLVIDISDGEDFPENAWANALISIGRDVQLRAILPTPRCAMVTLAQGDLPGDPEILRAAAAHNRIDAGGLGALPCAGLYAQVVRGGVVRCDDGVEVTSAVQEA